MTREYPAIGDTVLLRPNGQQWRVIAVRDRRNWPGAKDVRVECLHGDHPGGRRRRLNVGFDRSMTIIRTHKENA